MIRSYLEIEKIIHSSSHKLKFSNPFIIATGLCRPLIFQNWTISSNRIHSLKYIRSTTSSCKDIGIWKSRFVTLSSLSLIFLSLREREIHSKGIKVLKVGENGSVLTGSYDGILSSWDREFFLIRYKAKFLIKQILTIFFFNETIITK